jgi:RND family efflux transporter MFP subunit
MKIQAYKIALGVALTVCVALAAIVAYLSLGRFHGLPVMPRMTNADPVIAAGTATGQGGSATGVQTTAEPALAPVQITAQRMQEIGVTTALAEMKSVSNDLNVPGNVDINEQKLAYVQTRFPGWIQNVFANATYQYVRKGQPLFTIYSPDLVSSQQEYLLARKNQEAFAHPMQGHENMPGMATQESGWLMQAAEQRLQQFGVAPEEIANLQKSGKVQKDLTVYSPVSGYITERNALPNAYVQPETKLYTIADLSTVWVYANVFQNDVGRLKPGDAAKVTLDAYPGRKFGGRIDQILPQVDPTTRTVKVRLVMANPGLALKPGMYVNVDIAAQLGRQLVVPASAVLQSGQRALAFIDRGQGSLEPRVVTTGPQVDGSIVILSGLKAGDRVVSSANFLVDSEAQLQAAFQNFAPPTAPSAANNQAPAEKVSIAFSSSPATPRKGSNTVRVTLAGADGKPATGLQATVIFFMPAMPEMGMAAMHAVSTLIDKGNGNYEGVLELPSGGTWQVTITVMRGGQVVATKKLSADATGGM